MRSGKTGRILTAVILALAVAWVPLAAQAVTLVREPYLQSQTYDSIIIVWRTDAEYPGANYVEYSEDQSFSNSVAAQVNFVVYNDANANGWQHEAKIAGLQANTSYHYRIRSGGVLLSTDDTFSSAKTGNSFSFIVFGDSGKGDTNLDGQWGVAERIKENAPQCDFVIGLGDHVQNSDQADDYQTYIFDYYEDWMRYLPFWPVKGNHELDYMSFAPARYRSVHWDLSWVLPNASGKNKFNYGRVLKYGEPEEYYKIDYGNAIFLALDVPGGAYVRGTTNPWCQTWWKGTAQNKWVLKELAAARQKIDAGEKDWLFVYFHIGPYTSFGHGCKPYIAQYLVPYFEQYKVDIVFKGHEHGYERTERIKYKDTSPYYEPNPAPAGEGAVYINSGGGGADFYPPREGEEFLPENLIAAPGNGPGDRQIHHFLKVSISGKTLDLQAIKYDGTIIDTFQINK